MHISVEQVLQTASTRRTLHDAAALTSTTNGVYGVDVSEQVDINHVGAGVMLRRRLQARAPRRRRCRRALSPLWRCADFRFRWRAAVLEHWVIVAVVMIGLIATSCCGVTVTTDDAIIAAGRDGGATGGGGAQQQRRRVDLMMQC